MTATPSQATAAIAPAVPMRAVATASRTQARPAITATPSRATAAAATAAPTKPAAIGIATSHDGNNANDATCSADCQVAGTGCGNNQVDPGEECDDDRSDDNNCLSNCPHASRPEECDEGRQTASCDLDCTKSQCGDGIVNGTAGEQCDSGTPGIDTAHCTKKCRVSSCGDGYANTVAGEVCADGNGDYCGTCNSTCRIARTAAHCRRLPPRRGVQEHRGLRSWSHMHGEQNMPVTMAIPLASASSLPASSR
jgi:hypothetical protein